jgi:hypothetical protein
MTTQSITKWAGIIGLVLASLAFVFENKVIMEYGGLGIFGWWLVALLLATGGLCSESRIGKLTGWITFFGFLFFLVWLPRIRA